jgi:hypothetical protein
MIVMMIMTRVKDLTLEGNPQYRTSGISPNGKKGESEHISPSKKSKQ